jgi:hypothetical protein
MKASMKTDPDCLAIVLYGLVRDAETDAALFAELREITARHTAGRMSARCFKYNQRPDCVAHGGRLYVDGGRKG